MIAPNLLGVTIDPFGCAKPAFKGGVKNRIFMCSPPEPFGLEPLGLSSGRKLRAERFIEGPLRVNPEQVEGLIFLL